MSSKFSIDKVEDVWIVKLATLDNAAITLIEDESPNAFEAEDTLFGAFASKVVGGEAQGNTITLWLRHRNYTKVANDILNLIRHVYPVNEQNIREWAPYIYKRMANLETGYEEPKPLKLFTGRWCTRPWSPKPQ